MERIKFILKHGVRKFLFGLAFVLGLFLLIFAPPAITFLIIRQYSDWIALAGAIACFVLWVCLLVCFFEANLEWKKRQKELEA